MVSHFELKSRFKYVFIALDDDCNELIITQEFRENIMIHINDNGLETYSLVFHVAGMDFTFVYTLVQKSVGIVYSDTFNTKSKIKLRDCYCVST